MPPGDNPSLLYITKLTYEEVGRRTRAFESQQTERLKALPTQWHLLDWLEENNIEITRHAGASPRISIEHALRKSSQEGDSWKPYIPDPQVDGRSEAIRAYEQSARDELKE